MNGPQALFVNPGCFKCIAGTNLSPANKSLFTIAFILYFWNKVLIIGKSLRIGTFVPVNLLNTPLDSCSLINFDFLLSHPAHYDKKCYSSVFSLYNFWVFTFCIFATLQAIR